MSLRKQQGPQVFQTLNVFQMFAFRYVFLHICFVSISPATAFIACSGGINLHLFSHLPCCFHILCHFCFSSLPCFIQLVINGSVHAEFVVNNAFIFALVWLYAQSHACASYFFSYISFPQSIKTSKKCFLFSSGSRDGHCLIRTERKAFHTTNTNVSWFYHVFSLLRNCITDKVITFKNNVIVKHDQL